MPKVKLIYDPINGTPVPDGLCCQKSFELINNGGEFCFSNEIFFHTFRLKVKQGLIAPDDVETLYTNEAGQAYSISINKDGRCDHWPNGFCDIFDNILSKLIC